MISDGSLELIAKPFKNFKLLVLSSCEGFSTDGLASIAANCRIRKTRVAAKSWPEITSRLEGMHISLILMPLKKELIREYYEQKFGQECSFFSLYCSPLRT
ncbi:uncharacterized protein LOC133709707 isoform X1 [Rosa rugosa]|uniref:uncharacterized protein LOC133709707 isoform X1 n=1 Tax=Rosa rugosa TaxID=74645 RepID=UPI002B40DD38|nr:uncharacterized protein LOC133709707 isoform X1 [Rosa rugosa]